MATEAVAKEMAETETETETEAGKNELLHPLDSASLAEKVCEAFSRHHTVAIAHLASYD